METFLNKKYKLDRSENLDEFLTELGFNSIMKTIAKTLSTTVQLVKKAENSYVLHSTVMLITTSQKFKLGEEKELTTSDGRKIKNVFTIDGNKLIEKQIGVKTMTVEREYFDDIMIAKASIGDIVCTSWSKAVN